MDRVRFRSEESYERCFRYQEGVEDILRRFGSISVFLSFTSLTMPIKGLYGADSAYLRFSSWLEQLSTFVS